MDYLERYQAEQEERRAFLARQAHPTRTDEGPHTDMRAEDYPVTIIGVIRGVDGWYRVGFDEKTETIKPMTRVS